MEPDQWALDLHSHRWCHLEIILVCIRGVPLLCQASPMQWVDLHIMTHHTIADIMMELTWGLLGQNLEQQIKLKKDPDGINLLFSLAFLG